MPWGDARMGADLARHAEQAGWDGFLSGSLAERKIDAPIVRAG